MTRRRHVLAASIGLLAVVLTACGTSDPPPQRDNSGTTAGDADDADAPSAVRPIEHAMGSTDVPAEPERVIVLDTDKIDTVVTLGITPVGAARPDETGLPAYLGDLSDVEVVGTLTDPDLEAIERLEPDLILGSAFRQEEFYDELSAIAPTVFTELVGITWKENFLLDGDALGRADEAQAALDAYEERAAEFGSSLDDAAAVEVSIVRFMPDHVRVYGPDSFSGIVLGDTGLGRPEFQRLEDADDKRFGQLSPELIDQADGDVLFYCAYGDDAAEAQAETVAGSLWGQLSAVTDEQAYEIDDQVWMTGIGVTAAEMILDDLETHLAP